MEGLEFTILEHGHGENDAGYVFAGYEFGDVTDKHRERFWGSWPLFSVLIKHPTAGYIMYDTGPRYGDESDRRPERVTLTHPAFIKEDEFLTARLNQIGLSVNDISMIILSHCHWDHIGGLSQFEGTPAIKNIYTSGPDFQFGLLKTHQSCDTNYQLGQLGAVHYFREDFETPGCEFHLFWDDEEDFLPGIDLFMFEGHTPGVLGMMLHLESGNYLFPSDSMNAALNYGPPVVYPGIIYDTLGVHRAADKIRRLVKKYDAKIIYPHDPWNYPSYKKSPEWYK